VPIDFESYHPTDLHDEDSNGRCILEFLADDPDLGFRSGELAEELDMSKGSVGTTLGRFEQRGFVRHKGEYWAINVEAYDAHTASAIGLQAVAERFEGDYCDQNPDWDAELPDIDAKSGPSDV
jgi:Mn-dependent DtxR family transcriptional regulator